MTEKYALFIYIFMYLFIYLWVGWLVYLTVTVEEYNV